jgi:exopolysaccharide production protein ExoZ
MKSRADSSLIRPIQYLRAVSALVVVWVHSLYVMPGVVDQLGKPYFEPSTAIDVFFLISGFIMVVTTTRKEMRPAEFFCIRLVRIVPLYWIATLSLVACAAAGHSLRDVNYRPLAVAKSLLFVPYAAVEGVPGSLWPILQQGWTLNYEMFFYILFAISLAVTPRWRLIGLSSTLAALVLAGHLFGPFAGPMASVYTNPLLLDFIAGMLLAYFWVRAAPGHWLSYPLLLVAVGLCAIGSHSRPVAMGGATIIFAGCLHPRVCATRNHLLMDLGNASYSMYLSHQFVLDGLASLWVRVFPPVTWISSAIFMVVSVSCCAMTGCLCFRFVESPATSYLMKLVRRSTSAARGDLRIFGNAAK